MCSEIFISKDSLSNHDENHEESVHTKNVSLLEEFTCKLCSEVFIFKDSLLNHEKSVHTENIPLLEEFTCKLCSEVFITKDILLNHEQFVHTDDLTESNFDEIQKEVDLKVKKTLELAEASPQIPKCKSEKV